MKYTYRGDRMTAPELREMNDSPDRDPQLTDDKREGTDRATSLPEGAEDTRAKANNEAFDTLTVG